MELEVKRVQYWISLAKKRARDNENGLLKEDQLHDNDPKTTQIIERFANLNHDTFGQHEITVFFNETKCNDCKTSGPDRTPKHSCPSSTAGVGLGEVVRASSIVKPSTTAVPAQRTRIYAHMYRHVFVVWDVRTCVCGVGMYWAQQVW